MNYGGFDWSDEWFDQSYEGIIPKIRMPSSSNILVGISVAEYSKVMSEARDELERVMTLIGTSRRMQSYAYNMLMVSTEIQEARMQELVSKRDHPEMKKVISSQERTLVATMISKSERGAEVVKWRELKGKVDSLADVARLEEKRLASVVSDCRFHLQQISKGVGLQSGSRPAGTGNSPRVTKSPKRVEEALREFEELPKEVEEIVSSNDDLDSYLEEVVSKGKG